MISNSLIFKSTTYPEWYVISILFFKAMLDASACLCITLCRFVDRIQPWVHYIPISLEFSELHDVFVFFRGDLTGEGNHDGLAKKIALEGSKWAKAFWRPEDATAYMFR